MLSIIMRQAASMPPDAVKSCLYSLIQSGSISMDDFITAGECIPGGLSVDDIKEAKLVELSAACNQTIAGGTDVNLSAGPEHFIFSEWDQMQVEKMFNAVVFGAERYPYHSNEPGNDSCRVFERADIIEVYKTETGWITHHTTYHNALRDYVRSLTEKDDVLAVRYGQDLTGEYLVKYNEMMAVAAEQQAVVMSKVVGDVG